MRRVFLSRIALITDSTSDLGKEIIEKYNIHVLSLRIIYKDREYIDRVNITSQQVYDNLSIEVPSTSLPSMEDIDKLYTKLENEGYTHVIAVTISTGLSGTHNIIEFTSKQHPKIISCVFDSRSLTLGAGAIIIECGEMIACGKNYDEIVAELPKIRNRIKVYYVLDTLTYLMKGGRIGKVSGTIGEFFNIKPIISINDEGIYYTYSKVRGRKQSISKLVDVLKQEFAEFKVKVWALHGGAMEECKALYETVSKLPNVTEAFFGDIGPVAGVHTGPGLLGLVIMKEK
jgi:DegV family protein with EDD domain